MSDATTEKLTRLLAFERMKKLSDMYVHGSQMEPTYETITQLNQINAERIAIRDTFMKVVHAPRMDDKAQTVAPALEDNSS